MTKPTRVKPAEKTAPKKPHLVREPKPNVQRITLDARTVAAIHANRPRAG